MAINWFSPASVARAGTRGWERDQAEDRALRAWIANQPYERMTAAENQAQTNRGTLSEEQRQQLQINRSLAAAQQEQAGAQRYQAENQAAHYRDIADDRLWGRTNETFAQRKAREAEESRNLLNALGPQVMSQMMGQNRALANTVQNRIGGIYGEGAPSMGMFGENVSDSDQAHRDILRNKAEGTNPPPTTMAELSINQQQIADDLVNAYLAVTNEGRGKQVHLRSNNPNDPGIFDLAQQQGVLAQVQETLAERFRRRNEAYRRQHLLRSGSLSRPSLGAVLMPNQGSQPLPQARPPILTPPTSMPGRVPNF